VPIRCLTLAEGPPGIETQRQADLTIAPMLALAASHEAEAAGYVIACFGDPGLHALRDQTPLPVVGIQEAAVMTALTLGQRFGVIAILPTSIPRHMRAFGAMGVLDRLAGDRALGLGVLELADRDRTLAAMIETGLRLRDEDGANVLITGCAGMAYLRAPLEEATGLPVVEPCQAAAAMALGQIALNLSHRVKDPQHAR
jgi:Asp/Glu/hydantoin racemase